eukprot:TRINITY_DN34717_c0_g1_i2.p1 TRINITY_DN34717_c0_g1~~TRINITY_DN34717_c0_g1_i2.p1  ORF type:complete len:650 (+),score=140.28 TRINITY_DN34717_c0_g1_i2:53-1951(+)
MGDETDLPGKPETKDVMVNPAPKEQKPGEATPAANMMDSAMGNATVAADRVVGAATDITERCLKAMDAGLQRLDKKVPQDSRRKKVLRKCMDFSDPVQTARCSLGRLGFFLLFVAAGIVAGIEAADYDYWAELCGAIFVALLALFVMIFLGGDLFMFEVFKKIVNEMEKQIKALRNHVNFYESKLEDLSSVSEGLAKVYEQLSHDEYAVTKLLSDMERLGKLQTVAAVLNQFYAADFDGSGHISGAEADLFFPQVTILWNLVPGFDRSKVEEHVRTHGLTIEQISLILDGLVEEDAEACRKALETLCSVETGPGDTEALRSSATVTEDPSHGQAPYSFFALEAGLVDLEASSHLKSSAQRQEAWHRAAPPEEETSEDVVKPLFSLPNMCPTRRCGPIIIGGRYSVWGTWHLAALISALIGLVFLVLVIIEAELIHIILNVIGVMLALGLTGTGKLIEILRHLRRQCKEFKEENAKLSELNDKLEGEVTNLQKLKRGFDQLQERCAGNVEAAKELLEKSQAKIKMEAMATIMHLFKHAGAMKTMTLSGEDKDKFFVRLEQILRRLPGFDVASVRNVVGDGEMNHTHIQKIVDAVALFGEDPVAPPAPDTSIGGDASAPVKTAETSEASDAEPV